MGIHILSVHLGFFISNWSTVKWNDMAFAVHVLLNRTTIVPWAYSHQQWFRNVLCMDMIHVVFIFFWFSLLLGHAMGWCSFLNHLRAKLSFTTFQLWNINYCFKYSPQVFGLFMVTNQSYIWITQSLQWVWSGIILFWTWLEACIVTALNRRLSCR
jgi:hypothetical protein